MKRHQETTETGAARRKHFALQISRGELKLQPLIEYWEYLDGKVDNKLPNRLMDMNDQKRIGLDYILTHRQTPNKRLVLIRFFEDWSIFIKETSDINLLKVYQEENALVLFTNHSFTRYRLFDMKFFSKKGWVWKALTKGKGNENRWEVFDKSGNRIDPSKMNTLPLEGQGGLFDEAPSVWEALYEELL